MVLSTTLQCLSNNQGLLELDLKAKDLKIKDIEELAKALQRNCTLRSLNLSHNCISGTGADLLAEALKVNQTLTKLNLFSTKLGSVGAIILANALPHIRSLRELNVGNNNIGVEGVKAFARALLGRCSLRKLDLSDIPREEEELNEEDDLYKALKMAHHLKHYRAPAHSTQEVNDTRDDTDSAEDDEPTESNKEDTLGIPGGEALAKAVRSNDVLLEMNVISPYISRDYVESIQDCLRYNRTSAKANESKAKANGPLFRALTSIKKLLCCSLSPRDLVAAFSTCRTWEDWTDTPEVAKILLADFITRVPRLFSPFSYPVQCQRLFRILNNQAHGFYHTTEIPQDESVRSLAILPSGGIAYSFKPTYRRSRFHTTTSIVVYDIAKRKVRRYLNGHTDAVTTLKVLDGGELASISKDSTVKIWGFNEQEVTIFEGASKVEGLTRNRIALGNSEGSIRVFNTTTGKFLFSLKQHSDAVSSLQRLSGERLVSGSFDSTLKVWNLTTQLLTHTLKGHSSIVTNIVHIYKSELASSSFEEIFIWNVDQGQLLRKMSAEGSVDIMRAITGRRLCIKIGGKVNLLDSQTGKILDRSEENATDIQVLDFGKIVIASEDKKGKNAKIRIRDYDISDTFLTRLADQFAKANSSEEDHKLVTRYHQLSRALISPIQEALQELCKSRTVLFDSFAAKTERAQAIRNSLQTGNRRLKAYRHSALVNKRLQEEVVKYENELFAAFSHHVSANQFKADCAQFYKMPKAKRERVYVELAKIKGNSEGSASLGEAMFHRQDKATSEERVRALRCALNHKSSKANLENDV